MAKPISLPLHERISRRNNIPRAVELIILFLLVSLLHYRLLSLKDHGFIWILAFLCESCFAFTWVLILSSKWNQVDYKTYPERLLQRKLDLPPVDMFVTTADPVLEPPILTINTVLSLLAVDYPSDKLACYVSDDGASPLTFYSLVEASKFAKIWVPFCKKYNIQIRAPFRYFTIESTSPRDVSLEFKQEWKRMKDEYDKLSKKIEEAAQRSIPCELAGDFADFSNIQRKHHPTIIKVIWENKEVQSNGIPPLVYMSREKRPKHHHHYKAGAMNILTRVSGVMTNAPFMLNVDCDMYANNPQIVLHAMCLFLGGFNNQRDDLAFVQSPQVFYDGLKDDPFGNQLVVFYKYLMGGIVGIQGPFYGGTGCFHRRKVIYGLSPDDNEITRKLSNEALLKTFGRSMEFTKSTAKILSGMKTSSISPNNISSYIEVAYQVADCGYEYGTSWGKEVGWIYGSTTEDVLTGLTIHGRGWRSAYCSPDPPAFLGCAPPGGPGSMTQRKRWSTGLLEIWFSTKNPLVPTLQGKLQIRQCMAYMWLILWGLRSIPELCYAILPAYCIITNSQFMPKVREPTILIPVAIFVIYNLYTLSEYLRSGLSTRAWWNNQRIWRLNTMTAWFFGFLSVVLKLLGISNTVFEVTQKDTSTNADDNDANSGRFTFDESPIFILGTTILLVNLTGLAIGLFGFRSKSGDGNGSGIGEFICSVWVVLLFWAFFKGLFGKGKYGIPFSTLYKSWAIVLLFLQLCKWC